MIMKNVEAHRGQSPFRVLTRPGLALRRCGNGAENLVVGRLTQFSRKTPSQTANALARMPRWYRDFHGLDGANRW